MDLFLKLLAVIFILVFWKSTVIKSVILRLLICTIAIVWIYIGGIKSIVDWFLIIMFGLGILLEIIRIVKHEDF